MKLALIATLAVITSMTFGMSMSVATEESAAGCPSPICDEPGGDAPHCANILHQCAWLSDELCWECATNNHWVEGFGGECSLFVTGNFCDFCEDCFPGAR